MFRRVIDYFRLQPLWWYALGYEDRYQKILTDIVAIEKRIALIKKA